MISVSHARVNEDTVVIRLGHTTFANGAVLRPRWLGKLARSALGTRMEKCIIVRIERHMVGEGFWGDIARINGA